jgi:hypothetical protein
MAPFVGSLVAAEWLLAVGPVGNDWRRAALIEPFAQFCAVIGFVAEQFLGRLCSADETLCQRTIVDITTTQEEGKKTALSICDCVDFRVAPAARASNRLRLLPPFPPDAERCALTCVESIICTSVARPRLARVRKMRSQMPRSAHKNTLRSRRFSADC